MSLSAQHALSCDYHVVELISGSVCNSVMCFYRMSLASFPVTSLPFPCPHRRLDRLEGQTSRISDQLQDLSDVRAGDEGTHAQRFDAIFTSLRDVQRGVQVVRDKQVASSCWYLQSGRVSSPFWDAMLFHGQAEIGVTPTFGA